MKRVMLRRVYGSCRLAFWGRLALGDGLLYKYRAVYIRWVMQKAMDSIHFRYANQCGIRRSVST